jgi:hypothetical protein
MHDLKNIPGPKLLHVITVKGKGFEKAEKEQTLFHAPGKFDKETGELKDTPCQNLPPNIRLYSEDHYRTGGDESSDRWGNSCHAYRLFAEHDDV